MAENEAKIWLISRSARSFPWSYVSHSIGEAIGIYFGMYLFFLFFREVGIELYVYAAVFFFAVLGRLQLIKSKAKRRIERATGHSLPLKGDAKARLYMVMFFSGLVVITNSHPIVAVHFDVPSQNPRSEWALFVADNFLKALILDFFEIFELGFSRVEAVTKIGLTLVFLLRSLIVLAAFEFVRARIREINVTEVFQGTKDQAVFYLNQTYINPETFQLTEIHPGQVYAVPKINYRPPPQDAPNSPSGTSS